MDITDNYTVPSFNKMQEGALSGLHKAPFMKRINFIYVKGGGAALFFNYACV